MDKSQPEFIKLLHSVGADTRTAPTLPPHLQGKSIVRSAADCMFTVNGRGGYSEIKTANDAIDLSAPDKVGNGWRVDQQQWAAEMRERTGSEFWLSVMFYTDDAPSYGLRIRRDAFVVPFPALIQTIELLSDIQRSLPYRARPGMRREIQENNLDALNLWAGFRLSYEKQWVFPPQHPFALTYLQAKENVDVCYEIPTALPA